MGPLAIWPALAFLVLGAHFLRRGQLVFVAAALLLLALLFVPRRWAARAVQAGIVAATVVWIRTAAGFIGERMSAGLPYTRLAIILVAVTLGTAACLLVFRSARVKRFFRLEG